MNESNESIAESAMQSRLEFANAEAWVVAITLPLLTAPCAVVIFLVIRKWVWFPWYVWGLIVVAQFAVSIWIRLRHNWSFRIRNVANILVAIIVLSLFLVFPPLLLPQYFGYNPPWNWQTMSVAGKFKFIGPIDKFASFEVKALMLKDMENGSLPLANSNDSLRFGVSYRNYAGTLLDQENKDYDSLLSAIAREWGASGNNWKKQGRFRVTEVRNWIVFGERWHAERLVVLDKELLVLGVGSSYRSNRPEDFVEVRMFFDSITEIND